MRDLYRFVNLLFWTTSHLVGSSKKKDQISLRSQNCQLWPIFFSFLTFQSCYIDGRIRLYGPAQGPKMLYTKKCQMNIRMGIITINHIYKCYGHHKQKVAKTNHEKRPCSTNLSLKVCTHYDLSLDVFWKFPSVSFLQ